MQNHSYENEFALHEHERAGLTHFHMNGFALRLVLTLRQKELGNGLSGPAVMVVLALP